MEIIDSIYLFFGIPVGRELIYRMSPWAERGGPGAILMRRAEGVGGQSGDAMKGWVGVSFRDALHRLSVSISADQNRHESEAGKERAAISWDHPNIQRACDTILVRFRSSIFYQHFHNGGGGNLIWHFRLEFQNVQLSMERKCCIIETGLKCPSQKMHRKHRTSSSRPTPTSHIVIRTLSNAVRSFAKRTCASRNIIRHVYLVALPSEEKRMATFDKNELLLFHNKALSGRFSQRISQPVFERHIQEDGLVPFVLLVPPPRYPSWRHGPLTPPRVPPSSCNHCIMYSKFYRVTR